MEDWDVKGIWVHGKEGRFSAFLLDLEKEVAWKTRKTVTGLVLRQREEDWLLVLKASDKKGQWVQFVEGSDFVDCFRSLWVINNRQMWAWKPDRFYSPQI